MKIYLALCLLILSMKAPFAADLPYDEGANAQAEINRALAQATATKRCVLLVFGANWCPDCRELDKALQGRSAAMIGSKFILVKVDVGQFDKHMDIAAAYGNPTKKGIPAAVVLSADNRILYSTKGGELSSARRMGDSGIDDFFRKHIITAR